MEVTRSNFKEILPLMEKAIKNCDFIGIDTEFTGLDLPGHECSLFDNPSERYQLHKKAVQSFTLTQIGIACFTKDPDMNKYHSMVFNIYVYPSSFGKHGSTFTSQCASIEFLRDNGFNFNKFIYDGVPFLNHASAERLRSELEAGLVGHNEMDMKYFSDTCQLLTEWLSKASVGQTNVIDLMPVGNASQKWIFQYQLLRIFPQIRINSAKIKNDDIVKVTIVKSANRVDDTKRKEERLALLDKIISEFTGCAVLFNLLMAARKPLVGQNLLLDLMYFYEKFHDSLPEDYETFKKQVLTVFPEIYDTKHVATSMRKILEDRGCKRFGLSGLYEFLEADIATKHVVIYQPYIELAEGCKKYDTQHCPHEAGFDAYATGIVFIRMAHIKAMSNFTIQPSQSLSFAQQIAAVRPIMNKINLINAFVSYMNLEGDDPISLRPEWLLVTAKSRFEKLDRLRLMADLTRFGNYDVRPISTSKALVAVASHNTAESMLDQLKNNEYYTIRKHKAILRWSYGKTFAVTTTLVAVGFLACAWTWGALKGRNSMKT